MAHESDLKNMEPDNWPAHEEKLVIDNALERAIVAPAQRAVG